MNLIILLATSLIQKELANLGITSPTVAPELVAILQAGLSGDIQGMATAIVTFLNDPAVQAAEQGLLQQAIGKIWADVQTLINELTTLKAASAQNPQAKGQVIS
jgi:hypothetical protein